MKDFRFKKKWGQNFVTDKNLLKKIVEETKIDKNSLIVEIGPGSGSLTKFLVEKAEQVLCYEIDNELKIFLSDIEEKNDNLKIIYDDFLNRDVATDMNNLNKKYSKIYLVSNVPYYITTPIINKIINDKLPFNIITIMVQKELGERLMAVFNTKNYNSLSIFINYYFDVRKIMNVSRKVFYPQPKVDSIVLCFNRRKKPKVFTKSEKLFFELVKDSFKHKRKNIKNNLKDYNLIVIEKALLKIGYTLKVRAEQLRIEDFAKLANALIIE